MRTLIVIDMQNDFVYGPLGTKEAQAIVPKIQEKIKEYRDSGNRVIFTRDTHYENYLETKEGKMLPVKHCIYNTAGWKIVDGLEFIVDPECCAGTNPKLHRAALDVMKICQIMIKECEGMSC